MQEADANGSVTFTSIFPGCYSGRWPHIHFEVFPSLSAATSGRTRWHLTARAAQGRVRSSVYATAGYESSVETWPDLAGRDNVFSDGSALELATVTGSAAGGYTASLTVAVAASAGLARGPGPITG